MSKTYLFVYEKEERVTGFFTGTHPKRNACYPSRPTIIVGYKKLFFALAIRCIYERKETVEWPFGNIKQNLGLREFFTRGIKNVKNEFNLACISHNLTVVWGKMGGKMDVLC